MRAGRLALAAGLTALLLGGMAAPASAVSVTLTGAGSGQENGGSATVTIQAVNTSPAPSLPAAGTAPASPAAASSGGGGGGGGAAPSCGVTAPPAGLNLAGGMSFGTGPGGSGPATFIPAGTPGTWAVTSCFSGFGSTGLPVFLPGGGVAPAGGGGPPGAPPVPVISPAQLAQIAQNQIQLQAPPLQLSPAVGVNQIVHVPTWAWLPPAAFVALHATAAAGPVVVTATAAPQSINITYTDGGSSKSVPCTGAGTPYSDALATQLAPARPILAASPTCGWTFQNSSAGAPGEKDAVSATVTYGVTWTVTGAAGGGNLGALISPPTAYGVQVAEVQAIITH